MARATDSPNREGALRSSSHSPYQSASNRADDPTVVRSGFGVDVQRNLAGRLRRVPAIAEIDRA